MGPEEQRARAGRRIALTLTGTGIFWIVAIWAGGHFGLSLRIRTLFDLAALGGFGFALWQTHLLWRSGRDDER